MGQDDNRDRDFWLVEALSDALRGGNDLPPKWRRIAYGYALDFIVAKRLPQAGGTRGRTHSLLLFVDYMVRHGKTEARALDIAAGLARGKPALATLRRAWQRRGGGSIPDNSTALRQPDMVIHERTEPEPHIGAGQMIPETPTNEPIKVTFNDLKRMGLVRSRKHALQLIQQGRLRRPYKDGPHMQAAAWWLWSEVRADLSDEIERLKAVA